MAITLYRHNQEAYEAATAMLSAAGKAAVIHPTGTGKSFIGFRLCEDHPDSRVLWLSPSSYLFITKNSETVSRLQYGLTSVLFIGIAFALRQLNKKRIALHNANIRNRRSIVLVTGRSLVKDAIEKLNTRNGWQDYFISGIILLDGQEGDDLSFDSVTTYAAGSGNLKGSNIASVEAAAGNGESAIAGAEAAAGVGASAIADAEAAGKGEAIPVAVLGDKAVQDLVHGWVDEVFILQPEGLEFPAKLADSLMVMGIQVSYTMSSLTESGWSAT